MIPLLMTRDKSGCAGFVHDLSNYCSTICSLLSVLAHHPMCEASTPLVISSWTVTWSAGPPGPRLVAAAKLLAAGAARSRHPRLAAAVAEAVLAVLYTAVCRTASTEEGAGVSLLSDAVGLCLPSAFLARAFQL
jgi:hypothetical protein